MNSINQFHWTYSDNALPLAQLPHFLILIDKQIRQLLRKRRNLNYIRQLESTHSQQFPTFGNCITDPKLNGERKKKNSISGKQTQGKIPEETKIKENIQSFHRENVPVTRGVEKMSVFLFQIALPYLALRWKWRKNLFVAVFWNVLWSTSSARKRRIQFPESIRLSLWGSDCLAFWI